MKLTRNGRVNKQLMAAAIFVVIALFLIAGAFMEPKRTEPGQWVSLNEAVGEAIATMENPGQTSASNKVEKQAALTTSVIQNEVKQTEMKQTEVKQSEQVAANVGNRVTEAVPLSESSEAPPAESVAVDIKKEEPVEDGRLDINRATANEFIALKGIGPAKAQAIVDDRNKNGKFTSAEDLKRVKGIGEKLLQGIKESIVARP